MFYFYLALANFALASGLLFLILKLFPRWGWLDRPHKYGLKRAPIPYYAGVVFFIVFALNALVFFPLDKHYVGLLVGGLLVVITSVLDDAISLPAILRLGVQVATAIILVGAGIGIDFVSAPGGGVWRLDWLVLPIMQIGGDWYQLTLPADLFTIVWVIIVMNTVNWLDGIPGLVSGVTAIAGGVLFSLALVLIGANMGLGEWGEVFKLHQIAMMSLVLGITALAFCCFDFWPPKLLMGDSGTMFIGYLLAALAIFSGGKVATIVMIMGFPLLDFFWLILRRIFIEKTKPWQGDRYQHFHHRLLAAGMSERQTLGIIYGFCLVFGLSALFLNTTGKILTFGVMFILMTLIGLVLKRRKVRN